MYDAGKEDYLRPSEHIGLDSIGLDGRPSPKNRRRGWARLHFWYYKEMIF